MEDPIRGGLMILKNLTNNLILKPLANKLLHSRLAYDGYKFKNIAWVTKHWSLQILEIIHH